MTETSLGPNIDLYYFGSLLFLAISAVVLATFLRVKEAPRLTLAWRLCMICTFIWSFGRALMSVATTSDSAIGWMRFSYAGSIWVSGAWLWVTYELTGQKINRFFAWVIVGTNMLFSAANFTPWFIGCVIPKMGFRFYDDSPGLLYNLWSFTYTASLVWALGIVFRGIRKASGHQRNRLIAFFFFGLLAFLGAATTFPLVINIPLYPFGVLGVAASTVLMSYAVLRYNVMDANLAFRYGTIWVSYVFLGLGFSVLPFVFMGAKPNAVWLISSLFAVGGSPFLFERLLPGLTSWVDRLPLFRGRYLSRQEARKVLALFQEVETLNQLPWAIVEKVKNLVHARSCNVLLKDSERSFFLVKAHYGLNRGQATFLSTPTDGPLANYFKINPIPCVEDLLMERTGSEQAEAIRQEMGFLNSTLSVPIFFRGDLHAIVNISAREDGRPYNDIDLGHLTELAHRSEHRMETLLSGLAQKQTTSMWAHDLMKPFGPKGSIHYLQLAMDGVFGPLAPELKRAIGLVAADAGFVQSHLWEVMTPHQITTFRVIPSPLDIPYINIREKFKIEALKKDLTWIVDIPPASTKVMCDSPIIEHRVIANLIENAFRHTLPGGTVKLGYSITKTEYIGIVQDSGTGIQKEDISRLFKPGAQLNKEEGGLAGLGLASTKSVVESHKGHVWVESEWGKGSVFYFSLPLG
jgi:signal transduction histidine kinase